MEKISTPGVSRNYRSNEDHFTEINHNHLKEVNKTHTLSICLYSTNLAGRLYPLDSLASPVRHPNKEKLLTKSEKCSINQSINQLYLYTEVTNSPARLVYM